VAGTSWTTRIRSALTRKLDVSLVEAAGVRIRFVGLPMARSTRDATLDRFKAGKLPVGMGQILDPAAALSDPGSAAYFTGIRIRDSDPLRKQFK
jgi:hypothetical protein